MTLPRRVALMDNHEAEIWPLDDGAGWRLTVLWPSGERETHNILGAGDEYIDTICKAINAWRPPLAAPAPQVAEARRDYGNTTPFGRLAGAALTVLVMLLAVALVQCSRGGSTSTPPPAVAVEGASLQPLLVPADLAALLRGSGTVVEAPPPGGAVMAVEEGEAAAARASSSTAPDLTHAEAFALALESSPWPRRLWPTLTEIARCESQFDPAQVGDSGRSFGALQVHGPAWPRLVRSFDLYILRENLTAGYIAYLENGHSFSIWSCWKGGA